MATVDIPRQQKAAVKVGSGKDAKAPVQQVDVPSPSPGEILVKINWLVPLPIQPQPGLTADLGLAFAPRTSLCSTMNGPRSAWT